MTTVYIVRSIVHPEHDAEWNRWQTDEHVPSLLALPGYIGAQRFADVDEPGNYLNVWRLRSPECFGTDQYRAASLTAWFERLRPFYSVTVDFGVERNAAADDGAWRHDVASLVVERAVDAAADGSSTIPDRAVAALEATAGVVKVVSIDPIDVAHVRTPRSAPPGDVALVYLARDDVTLPDPLAAERRRYRPLSPYLVAADAGDAEAIGSVRSGDQP